MPDALRDLTRLRDLVRQRVWLVKIGQATKPAEETADDILVLVVERCAQLAEEVIVPDSGAATSREIARQIRELAKKR